MYRVLNNYIVIPYISMIGIQYIEGSKDIRLEYNKKILYLKNDIFCLLFFYD